MFILFGLNPTIAVETIIKVYDGDTLTLGSGEKVRLLQIDSPELSPSECYGEEARLVLVKLLNSSGSLTLKTDPKLDQVDRYGRLLRYVFIGNKNINLKMVELGAATPYFYRGDEGKYANKLLKAAKKARANAIGLWKECPETNLNPFGAIQTYKEGLVPSANKCDPNYDGCIPKDSPDLDCPDIRRLGLTPIKIIGKDIHRLDSDGNGYGCE